MKETEKLKDTYNLCIYSSRETKNVIHYPVPTEMEGRAD